MTNRRTIESMHLSDPQIIREVDAVYERQGKLFGL